jgi:hypothetical protein
METLSKDLLEKITNDLSIQDFLNFCEVNKKFCNREDIFIRRFKRDFGEKTYKYLSEENKERIKETYLKFVEITSKTAEEIADEIMSEYGQWAKFLSAEYKNTVRNTFFEIFYQALEKLFEDLEETGDIEDTEHLEAIISDFIGDYIYKNKIMPKWESLFPPYELEDEYKWSDLVRNYLEKYMNQIFGKIYESDMGKLSERTIP